VSQPTEEAASASGEPLSVNDEADRPPTAKEVREGWVEDPNLGDVPLDQQPHPGSGEQTDEGESGKVM
jgi:hypothetical protein